MKSKTQILKKFFYLLLFSLILSVSFVLISCQTNEPTPIEEELKIIKVVGYPEAVINNATKGVTFDVADGTSELPCDYIVFNDTVKSAEFYSDKELLVEINIFVFSERINVFFVKLSNADTSVVWTISIICNDATNIPDNSLLGIEPLDCTTSYEQYDSEFKGKIKLIFKSNITESIDITNEMLTGFDAMSTGEKTVTVSFNGFSFDLNINVTPITRTSVSKDLVKNIFAINMAAYETNEYLTDRFFTQYDYYYNVFYFPYGNNYSQITLTCEILERAGITDFQLEKLQAVLEKQIRYSIKLRNEFNQFSKYSAPYYVWQNIFTESNIAEQKTLLNEVTGVIGKSEAFKIATAANTVMAEEYNYTAIDSSSVISAVLSLYETFDCINSISNYELRQASHFIIDTFYGRKPSVNLSIETLTKAINLLGDILKIQTTYSFDYGYFTQFLQQDIAKNYTLISTNKYALEFVAEMLSSISSETVAALILDINDYVLATNNIITKEATLIVRICSIFADNYQKLSVESKAGFADFVNDIMGSFFSGTYDVDDIISTALSFSEFDADALTVSQINQITTYFNNLKTNISIK